MRVALSRWLARRMWTGQRMACSELALRKHPAERWIDAAFYVLRRETRHCQACADWEARRDGWPVALFDLGAVDRLRGNGL